MTYPRTLRHIAGSIVVVELEHGHYIDARRDCRDDLTHLEVVRGGQVYHRENLDRFDAPDRIVEMMRNHKRRLHVSHKDCT